MSAAPLGRESAVDTTMTFNLTFTNAIPCVTSDKTNAVALETPAILQKLRKKKVVPAAFIKLGGSNQKCLAALWCWDTSRSRNVFYDCSVEYVDTEGLGNPGSLAQFDHACCVCSAA